MDEVMARPGFPDILKPYFQKTEALTVSNLPTAKDLVQAIPGFPQSMPSLRSLEVKSSWTQISRQRDPDRSIDPFESLSPSLRHLSLLYTPLYPSILDLRNLVEFTFFDPFSGPVALDHFLTMLEENCSLTNMVLYIGLLEPTPNGLRRRAPISNQLEYLSVSCGNPEGIRGLISHILLKPGAGLQIQSFSVQGGLNDILSDIPATHFPNLRSPTHMLSYDTSIQSSGPNGSLCFRHPSRLEVPLLELPLLSFGSIRELLLQGSPCNRTLDPSIFPTLQTLAIEGNGSPQCTLSALFSSPGSSPLLETLVFLDCVLSEVFTESLVRFVSKRKDAASAGLGRVVIVHKNQEAPSAKSIFSLESHATVVIGPSEELPEDLDWSQEDDD